MASEIYNTIDALSREKGIDPQIVVSAVEDAIVMATRKYYKSQENLRAELDKETGKINAYAVKTVVETPEQVEDPLLQITLEDARKSDPSLEIGGELRTPKVTEGILGRIAAQLAKQVIFQKVREAERDTVYNEYIGRVNEVVNATVKRVEGPDVIFDIGKAEARMPRKEQSRLESFAIGERVRVVIARVEKASKGPGVVVSRAVPDLVQHLFQTEVPEIYDGTVVIRAIAREAGERTKIAVMSKDKDVDAVGACVGMKGMRVQSIIRELARRKDRHHRVSRRCGDIRRESFAAGEGEQGYGGRFRRVSISKLWSTTASSPLPSARRGRTCGWRRSCSAGRSTSRARKRSGRKWSSRCRRWCRRLPRRWRACLAWARDWWRSWAPRV